MMLWIAKSGQLIIAEPWKEQAVNGKTIKLYRDSIGTVYSSRTVFTWDELSQRQKAKAYRTAYESAKRAAEWCVRKNKSLQANLPIWLEQMRAESISAIAAIDRGEQVGPPTF